MLNSRFFRVAAVMTGLAACGTAAAQEGRGREDRRPGMGQPERMERTSPDRGRDQDRREMGRDQQRGPQARGEGRGEGRGKEHSPRLADRGNRDGKHAKAFKHRAKQWLRHHPEMRKKIMQRLHERNAMRRGGDQRGPAMGRGAIDRGPGAQHMQPRGPRPEGRLGEGGRGPGMGDRRPFSPQGPARGPRSRD